MTARKNAFQGSGRKEIRHSALVNLMIVTRISGVGIC